MTTFSTTAGHYMYRVMPCGLSSASSLFQRFINDVLREYLGQFIIEYVDDIFVYSLDLVSHVKHVCQAPLSPPC